MILKCLETKHHEKFRKQVKITPNDSGKRHQYTK